MTNQDAGSFTPEAGRTWPEWRVLITGAGKMTTVRTDSVAFQSSAMRLGTVFLAKDGSLWEFALYDDDDAAQGGMLFRLEITRAKE